MDGSEDEDDAGSEAEGSEDGDQVGSEDEEWAGLDNTGDAVNGEKNSSRGGKPKKPPTGEELRNIKDASELYRSNSFKLQVRTHVV